MIQVFANMKRPVGLRRIILQQNQQTANMKKNCWVYILKNKTGEFIIGFSLDMDKKFTEIATRKEKLYYLRPFEEPFDGLAHKHLLDSLSQDTINLLVRRNRERTEIYKEVFRKTQLLHLPQNNQKNI
ncbi:hypothetical protein HMPREF2139_12150 [Prevotella denticola DNF00960]|uniref:hypothetical protein n=1 Tax=Prevotella denticola TaxID=28129 RepID=UPI00050EF225|nr:hypothetical protein [Prevotella denticola]KGF38161.1 hypothetical protein HMPREF2139_12150 [Prevotella denticola DNF00960]